MRRKQLTVSENQADLATERERQLTTARANQTTGLTNGRAINWAQEVEFSRFRVLSRRQMTFALVQVLLSSHPRCHEHNHPLTRKHRPSCFPFLLALMLV